MTVKDIDNGKLISLSGPMDSRGKYLFLFYFIRLFILGGFYFISLLTDGAPPEVNRISFGIAAVLLFAAYRFLNKSLESEKVFIDKVKLQVIRSGFLNFKAKTYELKDISNFRHLEKPELSRHPLDGDCFDYLGFQTQQVVINEMHGDNRVSFDYQGKTISFGQNVWSWEFEELEILLKDMIGNNINQNDDKGVPLQESVNSNIDQMQPGFQTDLPFYQDLVDLIAVSEELQVELKGMLKQAFDDPRSFYNESGDFILSGRGLTYSIHSRLTAKFVLVDKMIAAKQMVEVDWKEAEEDIRIWILEIAKTKGYDLPLSREKRYTGDTFENIWFINDGELEPLGYCLEILNIDSDSYIITIIPLENQQMVHDMFDKLK